MVEILLEVASGIEVPSEHVAQGRTALATRLEVRRTPVIDRWSAIQSSASLPPNAYALVRLSRYLVLDFGWRFGLETDLLIPDDILLACRDRSHTAGTGANCPGELNPSVCLSTVDLGQTLHSGMCYKATPRPWLSSRRRCERIIDQCWMKQCSLRAI